MSTLLHQVHHHVLEMIAQLRNDEGRDPFVEGECASLALALYTHIAEQHPGLQPNIQIIYRHEMNVDTDEENSYTLSHVALGLGEETYDINGNNAVENWGDHVDDFEMDDENIYNELRITTLSHELPHQSIAKKLAMHCKEFRVSLARVQQLCERWGVTNPL